MGSHLKKLCENISNLRTNSVNECEITVSTVRPQRFIKQTLNSFGGPDKGFFFFFLESVEEIVHRILNETFI